MKKKSSAFGFATTQEELALLHFKFPEETKIEKYVK
jgi:hypothetical protein